MHARNVPNYLTQAILVTIFCIPLFGIFGIVAIIYAAQVNPRSQAGDYEGAVKASNNAKKWCWIGVIPTIASLLITYSIYSQLIYY